MFCKRFSLKIFILFFMVQVSLEQDGGFWWKDKTTNYQKEIKNNNGDRTPRFDNKPNVFDKNKQIIDENKSGVQCVEEESETVGDDTIIFPDDSRLKSNHFEKKRKNIKCNSSRTSNEPNVEPIEAPLINEQIVESKNVGKNSNLYHNIRVSDSKLFSLDTPVPLERMQKYDNADERDNIYRVNDPIQSKSLREVNNPPNIMLSRFAQISNIGESRKLPQRPSTTYLSFSRTQTNENSKFMSNNNDSRDPPLIVSEPVHQTKTSTIFGLPSYKNFSQTLVHPVVEVLTKSNISSNLPINDNTEYEQKPVLLSRSQFESEPSRTRSQNQRTTITEKLFSSQEVQSNSNRGKTLDPSRIHRIDDMVPSNVHISEIARLPSNPQLNHANNNVRQQPNYRTTARPLSYSEHQPTTINRPNIVNSNQPTDYTRKVTIQTNRPHNYTHRRRINGYLHHNNRNTTDVHYHNRGWKHRGHYNYNHQHHHHHHFCNNNSNRRHSICPHSYNGYRTNHKVSKININITTKSQFSMTSGNKPITQYPQNNNTDEYPSRSSVTINIINKTESTSTIESIDKVNYKDNVHKFVTKVEADKEIEGNYTLPNATVNSNEYQKNRNALENTETKEYSKILTTTTQKTPKNNENVTPPRHVDDLDTEYYDALECINHDGNKCDTNNIGTTPASVEKIEDVSDVIDIGNVENEVEPGIDYECVCLEYLQCPEGTVDIKRLESINYSNPPCQQNQVCCDPIETNNNATDEAIDTSDGVTGQVMKTNATETEIKDDNECTCVYYYLCDDGYINTDGKYLLDTRFSACDDPYMVCCKKLKSQEEDKNLGVADLTPSVDEIDAIFANNTNSETPKIEIEETEDVCECVNYYLCEDGYINTDGKHLLDTRFSVCDDPYQVCCKKRKSQEGNTNVGMQPDATIDSDEIQGVFGSFDTNTNSTRSTDDGNMEDTKKDVDVVKNAEVEKNDDCECVDYYLCDDGYINTDGKYLLDTRFSAACEEPYQVCCKKLKPSSERTSST